MPDISRFSKKEISQLFLQARCYAKQAGLTILCVPTLSTDNKGRILPIASKKVGNSPERNKIKRRLRAIYYENKLYERGFDCAVVARRAINDLTYEQLRDIVIRALDTCVAQNSKKLDIR